VATFPLSAEIWFRFANFALQTLIKVDISRALSICQRSIRNCAWSGKLWEFYLLAIEFANNTNFSQEFERALQSGIQTPEEIFLVFRANIDYHWRRINFDEGISPEVVKEFRAAVGKAKKYFGDNQFHEIHRTLCIESLKYDAMLLPKPVDFDAWKKLLTKYPENEDTWKNAIDICSTTPDSFRNVNTEQAREWYKLAVKKISGWPPTLCDQWRWFERIHGDIETYLDAEWSITRKQTDAMKLYQETQQTEKKGSKTDRANKKRNRSELDTSEPPSKKQKTEQVTLYVNNLPWKKSDATPMDVETLEAKLREIFEGCGAIEKLRVPKNENNRLAGFAFIDFVSSDSVDAALNLGPVDIHGRVLKIQKATKNIANSKKIPEKKKDDQETTSAPANIPSKEAPNVSYSDKNTLFASNLPFKATDDEIRQLFVDCDIKDIRLNRNSKNGLLLGYGYIEMNDAASVDTALKLNHTTFKGRKINVVKSLPKKKRAAREAKDRPEAQTTKDSTATAPAVRKMRQGSLLAPRTLLAKAATETSKEDVKPKSNDDFRKLFG